SAKAAGSRVVCQVALLSMTSGKVPPAATSANAAMDFSAASAVMIGVDDNGASEGTVMQRVSCAPSTDPVKATVSSTVSASMVTSSAPAARADVPSASTVQSSEICATGLGRWRPAHSTDFAARTRCNAELATSAASALAATTSWTAAASKRASSSATGSLALVIPATAVVPGMMPTCSAV